MVKYLDWEPIFACKVWAFGEYSFYTQSWYPCLLPVHLLIVECFKMGSSQVSHKPKSLTCVLLVRVALALEPISGTRSILTGHHTHAHWPVFDHSQFTYCHVLVDGRKLENPEDGASMEVLNKKLFKLRIEPGTQELWGGYVTRCAMVSPSSELFRLIFCHLLYAIWDIAHDNHSYCMKCWRERRAFFYLAWNC